MSLFCATIAWIAGFFYMLAVVIGTVLVPSPFLDNALRVCVRVFICDDWPLFVTEGIDCMTATQFYTTFLVAYTTIPLFYGLLCALREVKKDMHKVCHTLNAQDASITAQVAHL